MKPNFPFGKFQNLKADAGCHFHKYSYINVQKFSFQTKGCDVVDRSIAYA
jgi:hypothetical protein